MTTKICPQCQKTFEARRTDAVYCSSKCRVNAHLDKSKVDHPSPVNSCEDVQQVDDLSYISQLSVAECRAKIDELESQLLVLQKRNDKLVDDNVLYSAESDELTRFYLEFEKATQLRLQTILNMPAYQIYNTYLNKEYLDAVAANDKYAHQHLISEYGWQWGNDSAVYRTSQFFNEKVDEMNKGLSDSLAQRARVEALDVLMKTNVSELKFIKEKMRILHSRILKYETAHRVVNNT